MIMFIVSSHSNQLVDQHDRWLGYKILKTSIRVASRVEAVWSTVLLLRLHCTVVWIIVFEELKRRGLWEHSGGIVILLLNIKIATAFIVSWFTTVISDFAVELSMVDVIYISDCTVCTNSYLRYLGYITNQLQIKTQLMIKPLTPKREGSNNIFW